jgi:hypothetical protein
MGVGRQVAARYTPSDQLGYCLIGPFLILTKGRELNKPCFLIW